MEDCHTNVIESIYAIVESRGYIPLDMFVDECRVINNAEQIIIDCGGVSKFVFDNSDLFSIFQNSVVTVPRNRMSESKTAERAATERAATERAATERAATERAATERAATERATRKSLPQVPSFDPQRQFLRRRVHSDITLLPDDGKKVAIEYSRNHVRRRNVSFNDATLKYGVNKQSTPNELLINNYLDESEQSDDSFEPCLSNSSDD
jgi:hypothetical protein